MSVRSVKKLFVIINFIILIKFNLCETIEINSISKVSRVGSTLSNIENVQQSNITQSNLNKKILKIDKSADSESNFSDTVKSKDSGEAQSVIPKFKSSESTGRSASSPSSSIMNQFPLSLNFNTKKITSSSRQPSQAMYNYNSNEKSPQFIYPSSSSSFYKNIDQTKYDKLPSTGLKLGPIAQDRFTPGEHTFVTYNEKQKKKGYDYTPPNNPVPDNSNPPAPPPAPVPQPPPQIAPPPTAPAAPPPQPSLQQPPLSNAGPPPPSTYSFPPNINSNYKPPNSNKHSGPVTSYIPPPAGFSDDFDGNSFIGPVNPKYLPSSYNINDQNSGSATLSNSPPSGPDQNHDHVHNHDHSHNHGPPPQYIPPDDYDHNHHVSNTYIPPNGPPPDHDYSQDDVPLTMPSMDMMPQEQPPPPEPTITTMNPLIQMIMMLMKNSGDSSSSNDAPPPPQPPSFTSSDHDHHHLPSDFTGQYGVDAYPEIIYDHDPHHHHHHHDEPPPPTPPPTTTTEAAPPEPRVKQYSYYYLGRKLWYVPLYFTVYFTFYVAALIIKSIARHKVNLPNHLVSRSIRSAGDLTHKETVEKVERLTNFVITQIEDFKEKYL